MISQLMEGGVNWINAQRHKLELSRSQRVKDKRKKIIKVRKDMKKVSGAVTSIKVILEMISKK